MNRHIVSISLNEMSDHNSGKKEFTYKKAGVDIEAGEHLVDSIKAMVKDTHNDSVLADIGGFGGLFKPSLQDLENPVLVSSVDGVGTKLIVAFKTERYDTVGQDLVNHCVNDIAVSGADPLFFLDYFSTGKLHQQVGYDIVRGFSKACRENGVALVGGETAEMPDIYEKGEFDLAGAIVGMVDQNKILDGSSVEDGDLLVGVPGNGLHTNGYTLARKVLFQQYDVDTHLEEFGSTVGEEMLRIHRSYLPLIRQTRDMEGVRGYAHITGGGIKGNTKRITGEELSPNIDWESWERPPVFNVIQREGNVPEEDMRATFNLGMGLVMVFNPAAREKVMKKVKNFDSEAAIIGDVR